ncbi:UDP-N-acetylmuramate--L-alanine ligase [Salinisphaera sp. USBA-960]|nr:UDP-N-acetylmuramate--L-alanine ligase [Salifodinibacter halophilus]NNC26757.1 UDP-N-acetylmuramate--L-alanine ligase [Salifodinibacter halophilus]
MRRVSAVHLVGIGGAGMAGIARVLINLGYTITGSDIKRGREVDALEVLGAQVMIGHAAANVAEADVVVTSSAVAVDNPEVVAARAARVPVIPRAEMLAELMRFRYGIAVAGTHGKTTTTSVLAAMLADAGLDPTYIVGGRVLASGSNAYLGSGDYLVAEADESDASFLSLTPVMAVVTNIDADHMATFDNDFERLVDAFEAFLHRLPFYGLAVLCIDDPVVKQLAERSTRPVVTYGFDAAADVRAEAMTVDADGSRFRLVHREAGAVDVRLRLPGRHNIANALASAAIGFELGLDVNSVAAGLAAFGGIARRFEDRGMVSIGGRRVRLIDDYGHHPREIESVVAATRDAFADARLIVVFQPHRFSRTEALFNDFCHALATIDTLVLLDVYPAGESPVAGVDGSALARGIAAIGRAPYFTGDDADPAERLAEIVADGDVVLTLGAGDISALAARLASETGGAS